MSILFISNNNFSAGLSGGDRIFLELLRHWLAQEECALMGSTETLDLLQKYKLPPLLFYHTSSKNLRTTPTSFNIILHQITRTLKAKLYTLNHLKELSHYSSVYSVSDFFPDLIPGLILKLFRPKTRLICGFYLLAPSPHNPNSPYVQNHQLFKNYLYFYFQKISLWLINHFADIVFITSEPDLRLFPQKKTIVVKGGVDITSSQKWFNHHQLPPPKQRRYLGCFIGRFHPQKGILVLIDIWHLVVKKLPTAKLALIGNGQLQSAVESKIKQLRLQKNIELFGFVDGRAKEKLFRNSAIVLHPATFDSGGMAAAEAMAWGLPGISFDLDSLKTYYPQGMLKVKPYQLEVFADKIIQLSHNQKLYQKTSLQAINLTRSFWDWQKRALSIYQQINQHV